MLIAERPRTSLRARARLPRHLNLSQQETTVEKDPPYTDTHEEPETPRQSSMSVTALSALPGPMVLTMDSATVVLPQLTVFESNQAS